MGVDLLSNSRHLGLIATHLRIMLNITSSLSHTLRILCFLASKISLAIPLKPCFGLMWLKNVISCSSQIGGLVFNYLRTKVPLN